MQPYDQTPAYAASESYTPNNSTQAPQKSEEYVTQLQGVARHAREIWNSIGGLKETPGSLKVYTIIYHLLKRFRATFQHDLPLSMIVDGLSNNKDMRPVRNVNGLVCKACSLGMAGSTSATQKKHFSFPQLVNHFHTVHEQGLTQNNIGHVPDWTTDMVDLPDTSKLASIVNAPGMDSHKLQLFTEALPEIVTPPSPSAGIRSGSHQHYGDFDEQHGYANLAPSQDNHEKYYSIVESGRPSESDSVTYDSGEYDPRNPFDLPMDSRPDYKSARRSRLSGKESRVTNRPLLRDSGHEEPQQEACDDPSIRTYLESRPRPTSSQVRPFDDYGRTLAHQEQPVFVERSTHIREANEVEYRARRGSSVLAYEEYAPSLPGKDYQIMNPQPYQSSRHHLEPLPLHEKARRVSQLRPTENNASEQNRIFEVVAKISQQAQQARALQPAKEEPMDVGSEDGEVGTGHVHLPRTNRIPPNEASTAAERFLENFLFPGQGDAMEADEAIRHKEEEMRTRWETKHSEGTRLVYQHPMEPQRRVRDKFMDDERQFSSTGRLVKHAEGDIEHNGYLSHERLPEARPVRAYAQNDRYAGPVPVQSSLRERSPELVDRRYKLNNAVYRDERQDSHGTYRTPSRYARYESVRLENDRARSRSPVYVKMGSQSGHYRDRSPTTHPLHQESNYRIRTPPHTVEQLSYERAPRQEFYHPHENEPRLRGPHYAEAYELVRVTDPQGDYMIRRPVRREREPIFYENEVYARQPIYETRTSVARPEPNAYEEYDPRHPEPASATAVQQLRYH